MSCLLTSGLPLPCRESMPGLKAIYIANFETVSGITTDATNVVTGITAGTFYNFALNKEAGEFTENINSSPQNGTVAYEPTINLYLSKYATVLRNQIVLLAKSKLLVIMLDRNGQYWMAGVENGMDCTAGSGVVGKAYLGDPNGWNITFTGQESVPAKEVSAGIIAARISN